MRIALSPGRRILLLVASSAVVLAYLAFSLTDYLAACFSQRTGLGMRSTVIGWDGISSFRRIPPTMRFVLIFQLFRCIPISRVIGLIWQMHIKCKDPRNKRMMHWSKRWPLVQRAHLSRGMQRISTL